MATSTSTAVSSLETKLQANPFGAELSKDEYETLHQQMLGQNNASVPHLERWNSTTTTGRLVRYRGMVQDMLDPEYYCHGVLKDGANANMADLAELMGERQPLFLVPLPFASDWIGARAEEEQRQTDIDNEGEEGMAESKKRDRDDQEDDATEMQTEGSDCCKKHQSTSTAGTGSPKAAGDFSFAPQRQPLVPARAWPPGHLGSNPRETPVLAHFYYELNQEVKKPQLQLRLNDMVEVIGMLEVTAGNDAANEDDKDHNRFLHEDPLFDDEEEQLPSDLPRLHAVCYRRLNDVDALWLAAATVNDPESTSMNVDEQGSQDKSQDAMVSTQATFSAILGSTAAAEALCLSLFSQAERELDTTPTKTPLDATLGCASLQFLIANSTLCNSVAIQLQSVLQELLPIVGRIDLKDDKNGGILTSLSPTKRNGLLDSSPLQLPRGSMLMIVDHRQNNSSNAALEAVESLVKNHVVPYRFDGGMRFDFEADYRVLMLSSSTKKEHLPCTLTMSVPSSTQSSESGDLCISSDHKVQMREALRRKTHNVALPRTPVLEVAQQDFVKRRQAARTTSAVVEAEDFHRWLTLTRLEARRQGRKADATVDDWKNALRMDDAMKATV